VKHFIVLQNLSFLKSWNLFSYSIISRLRSCK